MLILSSEHYDNQTCSLLGLRFSQRWLWRVSSSEITELCLISASCWFLPWLFFLISIVGGGVQLGPLGNAATNGLLCQPRVIMMMEKLVELLAGETEVLGENLLQCRFVHHLPWLTLGPWRWMWYFPPKTPLAVTGLGDIISRRQNSRLAVYSLPTSKTFYYIFHIW
jgi:hypothetical protein